MSSIHTSMHVITYLLKMVPEVLGTSADIRYTEQNANTYTNERSKTTRNHLGTYTVTTLGSRYTCYR